jgi:hypothetical protein
MASDDDDYKVGYGKPPKHRQFKKGQSGWTKGRRKKEHKPPDIEAGLIKALSETATVTENGVRHQITKFEAACKQMANKAASGHAPTIRLLLPLFMRMAQQNLGKTAPAREPDENSGYRKLCEMLGLPPEPEAGNPPTTRT